MDRAILTPVAPIRPVWAVGGALLNTASEYGFGGVVASLPGFSQSATRSAASLIRSCARR